MMWLYSRLPMYKRVVFYCTLHTAAGVQLSEVGAPLLYGDVSCIAVLRLCGAGLRRYAAGSSVLSMWVVATRYAYDNTPETRTYQLSDLGVIQKYRIFFLN